MDGLDDLYANTEGYDETGNYITGFTRERGWIEQRTFGENRFALDLDFESNYGYVIEQIGDLRPMTMPGMRMNQLVDTWAIDIWIPITNRESDVGIFSSTPKENVIGILGATVNLQSIQSLAEGRKPLETGHIIICSNDGTVIGHPDGAMRGRHLESVFQEIITDTGEVLALPPAGEAAWFDVKVEDTPAKPSSKSVSNQLWESVSVSISTMEPEVLHTAGDLIVIIPIRTTSSTTAAFTYNSMLTPPWALITVVPMSTIMAPINALMRFSILFIIGAGILMVFVLLGTSRSLTQQAKRLRQGLEQASTMQDNLKYGLFLMDKNLIIQGAYSKALERIMGVSNLEGKSLLDLFTASIKDSQKQGLADYFEMVFKNAFDRDMLEDINPINEFSYVSIETSEAKSLRTSFTLTERGRAGAYILGTMEDITAEKELQKQLAEAESIRENEMRSLFQVIQLDPRVLSDFVADAEYEFDRINEMLKNRDQVPHEVLVEMYQAVHAIKSNALILNLESFSDRLHKLESSVRDLQEKPDEVILFDEFLGLVLELNDAMREVDRLKATVSKIENFKNVSGGDKNQDRYVLVETLIRVCNKTRVALNKKVRLVVDGIDDVVLEYGPRRAIKEVLTQLVRNAVYHGIETPEIREPRGKDAEGEIRLSMKYRDNQIVIRLADDGQGVDFNRVRKAALESKMVSNSKMANDKNYLLKAIFAAGFSTLDKADLHGGRGVGLSLVKDRVKDLHGNISVTTSPGKGTVFTITIPMELPVVNAS